MAQTFLNLAQGVTGTLRNLTFFTFTKLGDT